MRNHRLTLFFQQVDQLFLFSDERIDLGGFTVEEGGDGGLFLDVRSRLLWHINDEDLATTLTSLRGFEAALIGETAEKG